MMMKQVSGRRRGLCLLLILLAAAGCTAEGRSHCLDRLIGTQTFQDEAVLFGELTTSPDKAQWIFPQMTFTCSTVITSLQLVVKDSGRGRGKNKLPTVQIWRPSTSTSTEYFRVHEVSNNLLGFSETSNILSYLWLSLSVASGDILGFYQPDLRKSRYILSFQINGGIPAFGKRDLRESQDRFNLRDSDVENNVQIYPLISMSAGDSHCALGFLSTSSLWTKAALVNDQTTLSNEVIVEHDTQMRLIPGIEFGCSGTLSMITFAAEEQEIAHPFPVYPEVQVWRQILGNFYNRQQLISLENYYSGGHLNIFNVTLLQPVTVTKGDILGIYLPPSNRCPLSLKFLRSTNTLYHAESYSIDKSFAPTFFNINSFNAVQDFDLPLLQLEFISSCEPLQPLINGMVSSPDTKAGSVATYTCNEGYILVGRREIICLSNAQWSEIPPNCTPVSCGELQPPSYGSVRSEQTMFQAVAMYECEYGFSLEGDEQRVCTAQGVWSGADPLCTGIECPTLSIPQNGLSLVLHHVISRNTQVGSTAQYTCKSHHTLLGRSTRTCSENQTWTGEAPLCVADCPMPPNLPNGSVKGSSNEKRNPLFSVATYTCNEGFKFRGHEESMNISLVCGENSHWIGTLEDCEGIPSTSTSKSPTINIATPTATNSGTPTINAPTTSTVTLDPIIRTPARTAQNSTSLPAVTNSLEPTDESPSANYLLIALILPVLAVVAVLNIIIIIGLRTCMRRRKHVAKKTPLTVTNSNISNSVANPVYGVEDPFNLWNSNFDTCELDFNANSQDQIEDCSFYEQPLQPQHSRSMSLQVRSSRENERDSTSRNDSLHYEVSSIVNLATLSPCYDELKRKRENRVTHLYDTASNYGFCQYDTPASPYEVPTPSALHEQSRMPNIYGSIPWGIERGSTSLSTPSPLLQLRKSHSSVFFAECEVYWTPASDPASLYDQLTKNRYREIFRDQIEITDNLGSGQFGQVDKALWQSPTGVVEVAVKTLRPGSTEIDKVKFLQEAAITGQFQHQNVVKLHGVVTNGEPVMIVLEILSNRDLRDYLIRSRPTAGKSLPSDTPDQLLKFCADIASGMTYLAKKAFVHRDLAARNIFLTSSKTCKIGDFGLSRDLEDENYYISHGGKVPVKWTSPEALHYKKYSTASDVWSFGCVVYEIWSLGHKPFEAFSNFETIRRIDDGYRLPPPPGCVREVYGLMIHCWHPKSSMRPSFLDVHYTLCNVLPDTLSAGGNDVVATALGAQLQTSGKLYPDLQSLYNYNSQSLINLIQS